MRTPTALLVPSLFGALVGALLALPAAGADDVLRNLDDASLRGAAVATFPEYLELLSLPNDSAVPADIQRNATWLEAAFGRRGFRTRPLSRP